MAKGVQVWSGTAASNATVDSNINFAEGQAPSSLNDSCRAMMASVAVWRDDNIGQLTSSGTTSALTLATNQVATALTSGYTVAFTFGTGVAAGATLAVDGLAAKPLQLYPGNNLLGNEFGVGTNSKWIYSSTGTGQWIWACPPAFTTLTNALAADVTLTTTSFFDGPVVSQGSSGTWLANGQVTVVAGSAALTIIAKLWDGTSAIASGGVSVGANAAAVIPLSGIITSPAGNLRISTSQPTGASFKIKANFTGIGNTDSVLTAMRIG